MNVKWHEKFIGTHFGAEKVTSLAAQIFGRHLWDHSTNV